ncbi:hypothetical protein D3C75_1343360 [compost metagenome]
MNLLVPPRPVMTGVMPPVVDSCRNPFASQYILEQAGLVKHLVLIGTLPHADDDVAVAVLVQVIFIRQPRQIMQR